MTTRKTTKKALLGSLLALVLCFSMLVGTTFAWFTDSEVLSDNKIQAGTLDLVLGTTTLLDVDELWEPGYTAPMNFTLTNAGSLALKYKLVFDNLTYGETNDNTEYTKDGDDGSNITEVLDVYAGTAEKVGDETIITGDYLGTVAELFQNEALGVAGTLKPNGEETAQIDLVIKMQESAGNEYQGDWCNFDLVAVATQWTYEDDAYGNDQYDKNATYPIVAAELQDVLALDGGLVNVLDTIALTEASTLIAQPTTLTVEGAITSNRGDSSGSEVYSTLTVKEDTTINGVGTIENTAGYAITLKEAGKTLTINDGNYKAACTAINVVQGTLVINGGYFEDTSAYAGQYLINMIDANYANDTANVIVKGGTFVGWNPAASSAETGAPNLVADGYHVVDNGDNTYTVVADEPVVA